MGTTFVEINDRGFWMRDEILELWLRLLALHIDDSLCDPEAQTSEPSCEPTVQMIRDHLLFASSGGFNGCVPVDFQYVTSTDGLRNVILNGIGSLGHQLERASNELPHNIIRLLNIDLSSRVPDPIPRQRLLEVGEAIIDLLNGDIASDETETLIMPGSKPYPPPNVNP